MNVFKEQLTKQQQDFIDDMVSSGDGSAAVLQRRKISRRQYHKWMKSAVFGKSLALQMDTADLHGQAMLAGGAGAAAGKLLKLVEQGKGETTRKACVDVIKLSLELGRQRKAERSKDDDGGLNLSDDKAERILEILAEEEPEES